MHYGDKKQLKVEQLVIVVYKHGTEKPNKFDYAVTSIQICKYITQNALRIVLDNPNKLFKNIFHELKAERYYEVKINTINGYASYYEGNKHFHNLKIGKPKDVTYSKNQLKQLH